MPGFVPVQCPALCRCRVANDEISRNCGLGFGDWDVVLTRFTLVDVGGVFSASRCRRSRIVDLLVDVASIKPTMKFAET